MIPSEPQRPLSHGFLFFPPYRVQGYSIAGEETYVQIPEMDVCFDIGRAPKLALTSNFVALSHGHMDHTAGLAYYFSQRHFQGMGVGTVLCPPSLADPIRTMMDAWVNIEGQKTPYNVIAVGPDTDCLEFELKNHTVLRPFRTEHTVESLGFGIVEKRSKLQDQYANLPQEKLVELKKSGKDITYIKEIPHIVYMGDTAPGDHFQLDEVRKAKIFICECTFVEDGHASRAKLGKHLHIGDLVELLPQLEAEHIVLTHLSRRTHLSKARQQLAKQLPSDLHDRVHLLMDHRTNRERYQQQQRDAGIEVPQKRTKTAAPQG